MPILFGVADDMVSAHGRDVDDGSAVAGEEFGPDA